MAKEYKIITGENGLTGCEALNKFLSQNTEWKIWNTVGSMINGNAVNFILERDAPNKPNGNGPAGGSTEAALLSEGTNVVSLRRAA